MLGAPPTDSTPFLAFFIVSFSVLDMAGYLDASFAPYVGSPGALWGLGGVSPYALQGAVRPYGGEERSASSPGCAGSPIRRITDAAAGGAFAARRETMEAPW